jgi:hypothetical protein
MTALLIHPSIGRSLTALVLLWMATAVAAVIWGSTQDADIVADAGRWVRHTPDPLSVRVITHDVEPRPVLFDQDAEVIA